MTTFIISFIIWALLHSITATDWLKGIVKGWVGERPYQGFYRLFYNLFALATFLPVMAVAATQLPNDPLWIIPAPYTYLTYLIQLIGIVGLLISFVQTDMWEFIGLRQATRFLSGETEMTLPPKLVTGGMYAIVRHPLYFFSLLFIWFVPMMTWQTAVFNFFSTMYLWAGSRVEERRLADFFGSEYETYRQRVPGLIPFSSYRFTGK